MTREEGRGGASGGQLAVFGKGKKTGPVLLPAFLVEELSFLALPRAKAPSGLRPHGKVRGVLSLWLGAEGPV